MMGKDVKVLIHILLVSALVGLITTLLGSVTWTSAGGKGIITFFIFLALGGITFGLWVEVNRNKPMGYTRERIEGFKKSKNLDFAPQILVTQVSPPKKKKRPKEASKFYSHFRVNNLAVSEGKEGEQILSLDSKEKIDEALRKEAITAKEYLLQEDPKKIADLIKGEWWNE